MTACQSTLDGMYNPESQLTQMMTLFLKSPFDDSVSLAVSGKIRELFMVEGFNTDYYIPAGDTPLKAMWNAILFGTYVSYYLAIAYGIDPTSQPWYRRDGILPFARCDEEQPYEGPRDFPHGLGRILLLRRGAA